MQGEEDHLPGTYGVSVPRGVSPVHEGGEQQGPKLVACALAPRGGGGTLNHPPEPHRLLPGGQLNYGGLN